MTPLDVVKIRLQAQHNPFLKGMSANAPENAVTFFNVRACTFACVTLIFINLMGFVPFYPPVGTFLTI